MQRYALYVAIALFVIFIAVHGTWRHLRKKKKDAANKVQYKDPVYLELEDEKKRIKRKRDELELEHPFQKLLSHKIKRDKARESGDEVAVAEYEDAIEQIIDKYKSTEEQLAKAYQAQLAAMSHRLARIEIEQRHILLKTERMV